jgi:hypothetical protein
MFKKKMKYKPPEEVQERPQIWASRSSRGLSPLGKVKDVPRMRFKTCNRKFFGQVSGVEPRTKLEVL